jgi:hypothetical protein
MRTCIVTPHQRIVGSLLEFFGGSNMDCARLTAAAFLTSALMLVTGQAASQTAPTATMSYLLPRQTIEVSISFELVRCDKAFGPEFRSQATILAKPEPDLNIGQIRVALNQAGSRWTQKTDLEIKLNSDGTLQSIGATVTDHSAKVIGNVIGIVGSVARTVLLGGIRGTSEENDESADCSKEALAELKKLKELRGRLSEATLVDKDRAAAVDAVLRLRERLTLTAQDRIIPRNFHATNPHETAVFIVPEVAAARLVTQNWFTANKGRLRVRL